MPLQENRTVGAICAGAIRGTSFVLIAIHVGNVPPSAAIEAEKTTTHPSSTKEEEEPEPDTTLFVKNLNFDTTDETMRQHFESCGSVFSATVARKKDPKNPGQFLSMGYGFVQFWTKKSTLVALKDLQNSTLDGHVIELKV